MAELTAKQKMAVLMRRIAKAMEAGEPLPPGILGDDVAELLRVLGRMIEGRGVLEAFGAPGDWGYETLIGEALMKIHREGE